MDLSERHGVDPGAIRASRDMLAAGHQVEFRVSCRCGLELCGQGQTIRQAIAALEANLDRHLEAVTHARENGQPDMTHAVRLPGSR